MTSKVACRYCQSKKRACISSLTLPPTTTPRPTRPNPPLSLTHHLPSAGEKLAEIPCVCCWMNGWGCVVKEPWGWPGFGKNVQSVLREGKVGREEMVRMLKEGVERAEARKKKRMVGGLVGAGELQSKRDATELDLDNASFSNRLKRRRRGSVVSFSSDWNLESNARNDDSHRVEGHEQMNDGVEYEQQPTNGEYPQQQPQQQQRTDLECISPNLSFYGCLECLVSFPLPTPPSPLSNTPQPTSSFPNRKRSNAKTSMNNKNVVRDAPPAWMNETLVCAACLFPYHVGCLSPKELGRWMSCSSARNVEDVEEEGFGSGWCCPGCRLSKGRRMGWDVEKVLTMRVKEEDGQQGETLEMNSSKIEYLVKWKSRSFKHVEWVPARWLAALRLDTIQEYWTCSSSSLNNSQPTPLPLHIAVPKDWTTPEKILNVQYTTKHKQPPPPSLGPEDSAINWTALSSPLDPSDCAIHVESFGSPGAGSEETESEMKEKEAVGRIGETISMVLVKWKGLDEASWEAWPGRGEDGFDVFMECLQGYLQVV
ncbi:hypothetical protein HDV05_004181 [Chytridiales sp. JEL 0842]|nr:hypothetical protein HDV05_004181 [Chytridiales sp. JEL 0842]